jgi:hypothetical protein
VVQMRAHALKPPACRLAQGVGKVVKETGYAFFQSSLAPFQRKPIATKGIISPIIPNKNSIT